MNRYVRTVVLILMAAAVLIPLSVLFLHSLGYWPYPELFPRDPSLDGISSYLSKPSLRRALVNSVVLSLLVTMGSLVLGYLPAKYIGTRRFRGRTLLRIIVMLPALTPGICVVFGMIPVFIRMGIYRQYISILLGQLTFTLPYMIMTLSSVFEGFDENYERQSACLGVGAADTFLNVTVPRIKSGIAVGCMYTFIVSWSMYLLTYELSPAGLETMITMIMPMLMADTATDMVLAATAIVFFAPSFIFLVISTQMIRSDRINSGGGT